MSESRAGVRICVLGAGAMGAAMALVFDRAGNRVTICATEHDRHFVDAVRKDGTHPTLGHFVPGRIELAEWPDWKQALIDSEIVVLAVSTAGVGPVVAAAVPHLAPGAIWAVATKGWDSEGPRPLSQAIAQASPGHAVVVLSGPSLAHEMAARTPTGLVCASSDLDAAKKVARCIEGSGAHAFVTDDVAGVEVGAALKNVLAIAIGMCDGMAEAKGLSMTNTKAALFSRGLVEMARLAGALGGRNETVLGLAGAGDLFVTVLGGRNGRFGKLVGTGLDPQKAIEEMGTTVEGYDNAREAKVLAERFGLDLPVVRMVHAVLHEGADPEVAVRSLLTGPIETEM